VLDAFAGVEHILHAGDVGADAVLTGLEALAPVTAVRGNVDGGLRRQLPGTAELELAGVRIALIHGDRLSRRAPGAAVARFPDADLVVCGHSHVPSVERVDSVLTVNPGSAGRQRFGNPVTVALALVEENRVEAQIVELG
jgi:putative phosphoesterase